MQFLVEMKEVNAIQALQMLFCETIYILKHISEETNKQTTFHLFNTTLSVVWPP